MSSHFFSQLRGKYGNISKIVVHYIKLSMGCMSRKTNHVEGKEEGEGES